MQHARIGFVRTGVILLTISLLVSTLAYEIQALPARLPERVSVSLVLLDAVVTDKSGQPIRGLGVGDFELLVDNQTVPISSITEECSELSQASPAVASRRHMVIVFDISHMMPISRNGAIEAAIKYVEQIMTPADSVMILAYMRGLHILSDFTSDQAQLLGRLTALREDPMMVDSSAFEEANTIEHLGSDRARPLFGSSGRRPSLPSGANPARLQCLPDARQAEMQTGRALRAIANVMPALGGIPGRKALVLFTETLRSNPGLPFYTACGMPLLEQLTYGIFVAPELEGLKAQANLAGVSFYPVHAAGMSPLGTSTGEQSSRDLQTDIALTTGGKNFVLMKNPVQAFEQAMRDLSCYYVISYRPSEGFPAGTHAVRIRSGERNLRVRHRLSFTTETPEEASRHQFLAALSNPGLYRDLPVSAHVYSLGNAEAHKRQVLLHVSVPAAALGAVRSSDGNSAGLVLFKGGVIAQGRLRCEVSETVPFQTISNPGGPTKTVGMETLCALEPGEHEIVIAGRDEVGGGLGTFWGKLEVKSAEQHKGSTALLWEELPSDVWVRHDTAAWLPSGTRPYFVQESFKTGSNNPSSLTILVCNDSKGQPGETPPSGPSSVRLEGPTPVDLPAVEVAGSSQAPCRMLKADIPPGTLAAGSYNVIPRPAPPWRAVGARAGIVIQ